MKSILALIVAFPAIFDSHVPAKLLADSKLPPTLASSLKLR